MRPYLKILTLLWLALWLYIGVIRFLDTPKYIERDKKFIENNIKPSVNFVKNFKKTNGRLPNNREYYTWRREFYKDYSIDLTQQVDSLIPGLENKEYIRKLADAVSNDYDKFKNADWNNDFAIGVWRGEWTEYYFSWTDSYETNNYSLTDGYIGLAVMSGIGVSPLLFWWLNIRRRRKSSI